MAGLVLNRHHGPAPDAKYIGRGSPWGNPYRIGAGGIYTRDQAIWMFEREVLPLLDLTPLLGHDLLCSCAPKPCHGDPIIRALYRGL